MTYFPPVITAAGLSVPTYTDIIDDFLAQYITIFGAGVYLAVDSAEYQKISVHALKVSDTMNAVQLIYNNRGPNFAIGSALDSIIKLNGIARKQATYSSVQLTIAGTPGTVITNGLCLDANGNYWVLPSSVVIPGGGSTIVTATSQQLGPITAQPGTITIPSTPTAGWDTVTNVAAAIPGQPVETDSQLRARQAISTTLPSQTLFTGTLAGLAAIAGVTRSTGVENPTGASDKWGNPDHSITMVVEGGADLTIATTIYNNKGPGCYTNGTTVVNVTDPNSGVVSSIRFTRPSYIQFIVNISIHLLAGGTTATITAIQNAILNYLNSLQIGELLTLSGLYAAAMTVTSDISEPVFSIRALTTGYSSCVTGQSIAAAGTGYAANDVLTIAQANSSLGAQVLVTSVGGGGNVTGIQLIQNGVGYSSASGVATLGGAGTGCTITITAGSLTDVSDKGVRFDQVAQGILGNITIVQV